ncbi:MAG: hypothetical protein JSW71_03940 [Gemmatimonadota bacterium]|nr:MAG: hypothetical protein JSW71_03940 [Gemmatimonadota bacterium]
MIKIVTLTLLFTIGLSSTLSAQGPVSADAGKPQFMAGLQLGYNSGLGVVGSGTISSFARGFPLAARLGLWYTSVEPGQAWDARQIFINNATNGIPEEKGRNWEFKLDFLYPVGLLSSANTHLFGGVRHSSFTGNFKFVGGNEDFDVTSSQWGLGAGLEGYFGISRRFDLILSGGIDYYFSSTLQGHDTAYNPDNDNVNPREDFTYSDADRAIGQPKIKPLIMMGVAYHF